MTIPRHAPTVVFIAQLGTGGDSWQPVLDFLPTDMPTFTYDRPGTGTAPPRPASNPPLSFSAFAAELEQELNARGITGPLVVVGHSFGALIARVFASRNRHHVAGLVFVDGSIPRRGLWPITRDASPPDGDGPGATFVDPVEGEAEVLEAAIPNVPAAVLVRKPGWWPGLDDVAGADRLWLSHQRQLARLYGAALVEVDATHQIPHERPELVAWAVNRVVSDAADDLAAWSGFSRTDVDAVARMGGKVLAL